MSSPTNDGDKPLPAIEPVCDGLTPAPKRALVYTLTSSDKQYRKHTHTTMAPMSAIELKVACVSTVVKTEAGKREGRMEGGRKEGRERGRGRDEEREEGKEGGGGQCSLTGVGWPKQCCCSLEGFSSDRGWNNPARSSSCPTDTFRLCPAKRRSLVRAPAKVAVS